MNTRSTRKLVCVSPHFFSVATKQVITFEFRKVYALGGQAPQAIAAYVKANAWQELFSLAMSEGKRTASDIKALAVEVAGQSTLAHLSWLYLIMATIHR